VLAHGYPAKKTMGKPASSTNRDERPSMEQQCARIFLGSRWASSIIVRSREAWIEGMRPRTFGKVRVTSRPKPDWPLLAMLGIGSSNWKGNG